MAYHMISMRQYYKINRNQDSLDPENIMKTKSNQIKSSFSIDSILSSNTLPSKTCSIKKDNQHESWDPYNKRQDKCSYLSDSNSEGDDDEEDEFLNVVESDDRDGDIENDTEQSHDEDLNESEQEGIRDKSSKCDRNNIEKDEPNQNSCPNWNFPIIKPFPIYNGNINQPSSSHILQTSSSHSGKHYIIHKFFIKSLCCPTIMYNRFSDVLY